MVSDEEEDLTALIDAVCAVFPTHPRMKIEADVEVTRDANATVERIMDGTFLTGTCLDPRRYSGGGRTSAGGRNNGSGAGSRKAARNDISDSDEDMEPGTDRAVLPLRRSPRPYRTSGGGTTKPSYVLSSSPGKADGSSDEEALIDPQFILTQMTTTAKAKPKTKKPPLPSRASAPSRSLAPPAREDVVSGSSDVEIIEAPAAPQAAAPFRPSKPSATSAPAAIYSLDSDSDHAFEFPTNKARMNDSSDESSPPPAPVKKFTFTGGVSSEPASQNPTAMSDSEDSSPKKKRKKAPAKPRKKRDSGEDSLGDGSDSAAERAKPKKRAPKDPAKAAEKEAEKARKALGRARKKEEKEELQREEKVRKEELKRVRQVNRVMQKKEATKDMIVDIDPGVINRPGFGSLLENLRSQDCQVSVQTHPVPDTVLWRRRTRALWNSEEGRWEPLDNEQIIPENFAVLFHSGEELARRIQSNTTSSHLAEVRSAFPGRPITLLITGLQAYRKRKSGNQSAGFQDMVRQQAYGASAAAGPSRQQARAAQVIVGGEVVSLNDLPVSAEVDQELMRLQIIEKVQVIECEDCEEAIDFMIGLTTEIAMIPHKALRENLLDFCPDGKLRKTGTDGAETWLFMLRQIHLVEDSSASAVVKQYPTLNSLFTAYQRCATQDQAEKLLADIVVQRYGKSGETNRRLGPALSKRIYTVLMGEDPEETAR